MVNKINDIGNYALQCVKNAISEKELDEIRIKYLGKKGQFTELLKGLKNLPIEERKTVGALANRFKTELEKVISECSEKILENEINHKLKSEKFDISFPGEDFGFGTLHPVTIVQKQIEKIFTDMGFMIADGPECVTDYYCFKALNIPENHPARDMQDTYYLENGQLLRTQTSAVQVKVMEEYRPPLKVIAPGRCFRNEDLDACHENTFFQLEGMMIDKGISISNLIYFMKTLLTKVFGRDDIKIRLRPGYFPFVEPGFELDLSCLICHGKGCPTCKQSGWLELLPCGMIHPNVLKFGSIDPDEYSGFAFGLGLTRLAMMKFGIKDIRYLNSGDLRALKQIHGE